LSRGRRIPFGAEAARIFGRVTAAVITVGCKPRRRIADLLIAATAIAEGLPLFTTNPGDFTGLDTLLAVIPVTGPDIPHKRPRDFSAARPRLRRICRSRD
jgi:predicted nucleic acid-binding protein